MKDFIIWVLIVPPTACSIFWIGYKVVLYVLTKGNLL